MSPAQGGYGTYMLIFQQPLDMQHLVLLLCMTILAQFMEVIIKHQCSIKMTHVASYWLVTTLFCELGGDALGELVRKFLLAVFPQKQLLMIFANILEDLVVY